MVLSKTVLHDHSVTSLLVSDANHLKKVEDRGSTTTSGPTSLNTKAVSVPVTMGLW